MMANVRSIYPTDYSPAEFGWSGACTSSDHGAHVCRRKAHAATSKHACRRAVSRPGSSPAAPSPTAQDRSEPTKWLDRDAHLVRGEGSEGRHVRPDARRRRARAPCHDKGGRVVYWLDRDTAKKLAPHVGHQIRVVGKITDVEQAGDGSEGDRRRRMFVEIEGPGQRRADHARQGGVSAAGPTEARRTSRRRVVKLKVDKLEMVADRCNLTR